MPFYMAWIYVMSSVMKLRKMLMLSVQVCKPTFREFFQDTNLLLHEMYFPNCFEMVLSKVVCTKYICITTAPLKGQL